MTARPVWLPDPEGTGSSIWRFQHPNLRNYLKSETASSADGSAFTCARATGLDLVASHPAFDGWRIAGRPGGEQYDLLPDKHYV